MLAPGGRCPRSPLEGGHRSRAGTVLGHCLPGIALGYRPRAHTTTTYLRAITYRRGLAASASVRCDTDTPGKGLALIAAGTHPNDAASARQAEAAM